MVVAFVIVAETMELCWAEAHKGTIVIAINANDKQ